MKDYIFSLLFILSLSIPKFHICYLLVICASHVSFLSCISGEWFSHSVVSNSCDSTDWSPPGSSVHGILQARVPEWVAVSYRGVERIKVVSLVADHPTTAGCWILCIKSKHGGWLWSLQILHLQLFETKCYWSHSACNITLNHFIVWHLAYLSNLRSIALKFLHVWKHFLIIARLPCGLRW